MTRETKIGLLVGLAFIIVIGILLSDHIQSTTEPPQAALTQAGNSVHQGVNTPGTVNPPITLAPAGNVAPQQNVPTNSDLNPTPQANSIVHIGPPVANVNNPNPATVTTNTGEQTWNNVVPQDNTPTQIVVDEHTGTVDQALAQAAAQHHEELVGADAPRVTTQTGQQYKAEAGDNLSKLATKFFGSNSKANREAIVKANPSLEKNPDLIVVGRTYNIPSLNRETPPTVTTAQTPSVVAAAVTPVSAQPEYWYTVKEGDNLWKIAREQFNDARAVASIKELNKTTLKGDNKDVVIVNMKLRLPGKPVASAD